MGLFTNIIKESVCVHISMKPEKMPAGFEMTTGNPLMDILNGSIADLGAVPVIPDKKIGKLIKKIVKKDKPTPDIDDDYILMPKGEKEEE